MSRINVTKSYLPDFNRYAELLHKAWDAGWLTNNGILLQELEERLRDYLGVKHLLIVNNGTTALQIGAKALGWTDKKILTTPFSYVATTSALVWEESIPVFGDIDPQSLCLSPATCRAVLEQDPTIAGILPTHVYGNACDIEAFEAIAAEYNLTVMYDAAHAFACQYDGQSLLSYGNVSTLSFHATKLYHMGEGGALITDDDELAHQFSYLRNFGHDGPESFQGEGINGKNSELHAALGLAVLEVEDIDEILAGRARVVARYDELLNGLPIFRPTSLPKLKHNGAYYPVVFTSETVTLRVKAALEAADIFPRRYFYPSLTTLPYIDEQSAPVSEDIASRVMCLPLYPDLADASIDKIARIVKATL